MVRTILVGAALVIGVTAAVAQSNVIETRRNTMKGVGAATRIGTQMSKGEIPFDAAKAKEVLATYAKAADVMHTYFPDNSKTGGETTASPKIWGKPGGVPQAVRRLGGGDQKGLRLHRRSRLVPHRLRHRDPGLQRLPRDLPDQALTGCASVWAGAEAGGDARLRRPQGR